MRIKIERELTRSATEHGRRSALCFTVGASKRMHVHMHVLFREGFERSAILDGKICRIFQDQAGCSIPNGLFAFVFDSAFADEVSLREQFAPTTFARANKRTLSFDERRRTRLREARSVAASIHEWDRRKTVHA